jgi:hypothetical protein
MQRAEKGRGLGAFIYSEAVVLLLGRPSGTGDSMSQLTNGSGHGITDSVDCVVISHSVRIPSAGPGIRQFLQSHVIRLTYNRMDDYG